MKILPQMMMMTPNNIFTIDNTYSGSYFEKRGVSQDIFKKFNLGTIVALAQGFPQSSISKYFVGAPIFPIYDMSGIFLGWGLRPGHEDFKYYYFNVSTSKTLYGMPFAHTAIRQKNEVLVVEGFFDVLLAHSAGIDNAVGVFSNQLSKSQILMLGSLTNNFKLALDADTAGLTGMQNSRDLVNKLVPDANVEDFLVYPHHDFCDFALDRINNGI
jgi:DNA primase